MKKSIICLIIFFPIGLFVIGNSLHETLNPKVAEIVHNSLLLDESTMEQNIYVALLGLAVPCEEYVAIAKQVILNNAEKMRQAINAADETKMQPLDEVGNYYSAEQELIFSTHSLGKDYLLPCQELSNFHCLTDIVKQELALKKRIADNKVLLERYQYISTLPYYRGYYQTITSPSPRYDLLIKLSDLRLAQAVFFIHNQQVSEGFKLLNDEMAFYKKMLAGEDTLIGPMIAIKRLFLLYHLIAELIDSPLLANELESDKVKSLMMPLTVIEQQSVARSLAIERNGWIYQFLTLINDDHLPLWRILYDRNACANKAYQQFLKPIELAQITIPEATPLPVKEPKQQFTFKKLIQEKGLFFLRNYYGEILLDTGRISYASYSNRLYNLEIYRYLVSIKWQMKQKKLKPIEVNAWLASQPVTNPYTHQPIYWDAKKQCLMTDWADRAKLRYDTWGSEQPQVHIN